MFETLWKFLASVRLTVVLLLTLAATSVFGTLIPQNQPMEVYFRAYGEVLYRFFALLGMFDMYHAGWFRLLIFMLALNIIVCSIDRFPKTWKLVRADAGKKHPDRFRRIKTRHTYRDPRTPDQLRPLIGGYFQKHFGAPRVEDTDAGFYVIADRLRWSRLGVYIVHFSVVLLLLGSLIGSIFGFEGFVNIAEGDTVDTIRLRNSNQTLKLPFSVRCDDFDVSFYETGAPREFRSDLSLIRGGQTIYRKRIVVNDPLRFEGINLFQSSYGTIPSETAVFEFTSAETGMVYRHSGRPGQTIHIPEDLGNLEIKSFTNTAFFRGHPIGPAFLAELTTADGQRQEITLPIRFPTFDRMRKGRVMIAVGEQETRYYTGLQVTRDPGVWVVYAGFIMMIAGCVVTFFLSHQQVFVEVEGEAGGSRILLTGTASKKTVNVGDRLERMAGSLAALNGSEPDDSHPKEPS